MYAIILKSERQTVLFSLIVIAIILGRIGGLLPIVFVRKPPSLFIALIVVELLAMPVLLLWQLRISSNSAMPLGFSRIQGACPLLAGWVEA